MRICYRIAILLGLVFVQHTLKAQNIVSDFNTVAAGDEGWTSFNTSTGASSSVTYNATGGNPAAGGYISFTSAGLGVYFEAPSKFNANFSSSYRLNLSFDLKQSGSGIDNTNGDLILTNSASGIVLYYQLPSKPATANFTSYTVQLLETFPGWHYGSPGGPAPTRDQMKGALVNLTKLRIRLNYLGASETGSLDNVVLQIPTLATPPAISSISPVTAVKGTSVTITGINFDPSVSQNNVFFNGVKAVITSATTTQLVATVPTSAPPGPITVVNLATGLQATSKQAFNLQFNNSQDNGGAILPASMLRGNSTLIPLGNNSNNFGGIGKADFDGDGWVDLVLTETATNKIYAYRNLGTGGTVTPASFGSQITLPSLSTVPGGSPSLTHIKVVDIDSDGKPDVAVICASGAGTAYFTIYQNTSTSGTVSFAAPQYFPMPFYSSLKLHTADLDGDGRMDLLACTGTSPSNLYVARNQSTPGSVDFAYGQFFGPNTGFAAIGTGDMDSDGKEEVILANSNKFVFLANASTPGIISLTPGFTLNPNIATGTINNFKVTDIDGDFNPDLMWTEGTANIYAKGNLHVTGPVTAAAFSSDFVFASPVQGTSDIDYGDINSDGKPDIVVVGTSDMGIFQNIGTGLLNGSYFSPGRIFQGSASGALLSNQGPIIADLDGDSKAEVVMCYAATGASSAEKGIYIFHNESFPVPTLTAISPASGGLATSIAATGSLLNTGVTSSPSIRLGSTLTTSTPVANTEIDFTVPLGSVSDKVFITNHGLTSVGKRFKSTFRTNRVINSSTFPSSVDFSLAPNNRDALVAADVDDDGKTDVMTTENFGDLRIFQNTQATAGTPITTSSLTELGSTLLGGYNSTVYDIDGDGKADLVSGSGIYKNNSTAGTISFGPRVVSGYQSFVRTAVADFNKDGKLDYASTSGSASLLISENQSSRGNFVAVGSIFTYMQSNVTLTTGSTSLGIVAEDFDGDGYEDLITVNQSSNNMTIYLNTKQVGQMSASSFSFLGNYSVAGSQPNGITAADFDGDGKIDVAVSYFNSSFVSVYRNASSTGDISFSGPINLGAANKGYNLAAQDLDGDGSAEIVVIHQPNPGPGSFTVFQNTSTTGSISFSSGVNFGLTRNPQALAIADINNDTKPDILIVGSGASSALSVFENKITSIFDTNRIIYSRPDKTIWSTAGDGSPDKFLANGYFARLSQDGRYLLYLNGPNPETSSRNELYTKDLLTNVVTKVFSNPSDYIVAASWSPDGSKIIFDYNCYIWSMNRDGSGVTNITGSDCYDDAPAIRLTDGAVTFHNEHNGIFYMNANGTGRTFVPNTQPNDFWPTWTPDGQWIVFGRYTGPSGTLINIFKIHPDGSNLTPLTNLAGNQVGPWIVSNDGLSVLAAGTIACATGIFEFPMDGSQTFKLINNAGASGAMDWVGSEIGTPPLTYVPTTGAPTITSVNPNAGSIGWTVVITGTNFNPTPISNTVKFNGLNATVVAASLNSLTVVVPAGATSGTVTVTTSCGTGTSPVVFTVTPLVYNTCRNVINLNGTTDGVRVPDNSALHTTSITLEAMVNFSSVPSSGFAQIIGKPYQPATGVAESYAIHYSNGKLFGGWNPATVTIYASWTPVVGQWYHVALTYDQATTDIILYIDGAKVASDNAPANLYDASDLRIGMDVDFGANTGFFPGQIDEVRLWNVARTPLELQSTLTGTLTGNESGLVTYYKMDDNGQGAGITAVNSASSGSALDAVTIGSASTPSFICTCPPAITSFSPASGTPGSTVTISGTGFDPIAANNQVKFNGVVASVAASTSTNLTVTVPASATTGPISVQTCATATTPTNFTVTTPSFSISITTQPNDVTVCKFGTGTFTVAGTGTTNITYQWQFATTSAGPFKDISNGTNYTGTTTASLAVNSLGNFGTGRYRCKINGDFATTVFSNDAGFTISNAPCSNAAPVIQAAVLTTTVGGSVSISLASLISDIDNNLDLSTLAIIKAPSSGAAASIKPDRTLVLDYSGVRFAGTDNLTIQVCDFAGSCSQQQITITVSGEIVIYNAISANGDGKNEVFYIGNIDSLPETKKNTVTIFDRWGAIVFETSDYDNTTHVFRGVNQDGASLPAGTYFYRIVFASGLETKTGFISLRK